MDIYIYIYTYKVEEDSGSPVLAAKFDGEASSISSVHSLRNAARRLKSFSCQKFWGPCVCGLCEFDNFEF